MSKRLMKRSSYVIGTLVVGLLLAVRPLRAQAVPVVGVEFGVGVGHGYGGPPIADRTLIAISGQVAAAVYRRGNHGVVAAVQLDGLSSGIMRQPCLPKTHSPCQDYPAIAARSLLLGWARADQSNHLLRVLLGPSSASNEYVDQDKVKPANFTPTRGRGAAIRVDWSHLVARHTHVVVFGTGLLAPSWQGYRFGSIATGIAGRVAFPSPERRR